MTKEQLGTITLVQGDCMEFMAEMPDFSFDLTIIEKDPIYYHDAKERLIREQQQLQLFGI